MEVQGLIQAAGSGERLGLGPKAFVALDGITLLERAVGLLRDRVDSIVIAVRPGDLPRALALVGDAGVTIISGAASRSETTRRLVQVASAPWLVLHDVVHPFATPALLNRLLAAAKQAGASAPGLVNTEFLYRRDGQLLHAPGEVLVGQKPVVFSRSAARAGYAALPAGDLATDPSLIHVLELAGVRTAFVESSAANIKITTPADLHLARALIVASGVAETGSASVVAAE